MRQFQHQSKFTHWLAGAMLVVGTGAIAASPAQAQSISFDETEQYRTYTHSPDPDSLYEYGESAAIRALTDGDSRTNVELWYKSEVPGLDKEVVLRNVGFTATNGRHKVRVTSVRADEWDVYGQQWVNDFLKEYSPFDEVMAELSDPAKEVFESSFRNVGLGDPNVTEFSLDEEGNISLQTAGFYDLRSVLEKRASAQKETVSEAVALATAPLPLKQAAADQAGITVEKLDEKIAEAAAVDEGLSALLMAISELDEALQASEVAKVEVYEDGVLQAVEYAYTFEMAESGIEALDDGESYSGLAEWTRTGSGTSAAVPEPSFLLGAAIAGGLFRAAKRRSQG
ncbi:MAG: NF038130 family PEP-CTERM protein [Cyanobacteria bacterium P01_G01_bin.54]